MGFFMKFTESLFHRNCVYFFIVKLVMYFFSNLTNINLHEKYLVTMKKKSLGSQKNKRMVTHKIFYKVKRKIFLGQFLMLKMFFVKIYSYS